MNSRRRLAEKPSSDFVRIQIPPSTVIASLLNASARIPRMPTVLRPGPYRFYFYSHEPNEPPHIHAGMPTLWRVSYRAAKMWVSTLFAAKSGRGVFFSCRKFGACPTQNNHFLVIFIITLIYNQNPP